MCEGGFSSSWIDKEQDFLEKHPWRERKEKWQLDQSKVLEIIDLAKSAKSIEFKGGEPLLDPRLPWILEEITKVNSNIHTTIVTNFTHITPKVAQALEDMNNLTLNISVDGIGLIYEWIRGFSFSKIQENIHNMFPRIVKDHQIVTFNYVTSIYNLNHIGEFAKWVAQLANHLDIRIIPRFNLIACYPYYLSPNLIPNDNSNWQTSICDAKNTLNSCAKLHASDKVLISNDLDVLTKFCNDKSNIPSDAQTRHQIWHSFLVKIRGWDIKNTSCRYDFF